MTQQPTVSIHCPECGYDLQGTDSPVCSECGLAVDRAAIAAIEIPWQHRASRGTFRSFLATINFAARTPTRLADQYTAAVSHRDAQRFRIIVFLLLLVPIGMVVTLGSIAMGNNLGIMKRYSWMIMESWGMDWFFSSMYALLHWPVALAMCAAFLLMMTGIHSYLFHPKRIEITRQNRAISLSYYCIGPLVMIEFIAIVAVAPVVLYIKATTEMATMNNGVYFLLSSLILIFLGIWLLLWIYRLCRCVLVVYHRATLATRKQTILFVPKILFLWFLTALLCFGLIPALIGFVLLAIAG